MSTMVSQINGVSIVCSTVCSGADKKTKHESSASLAFVRGNRRSPIHSPHKDPVTQKMFEFDDVIINHIAQEGSLPISQMIFLSTSKIRRIYRLVTYSHSNNKTGKIHISYKPLQWRHNGRECISNHQPHDCFLNRLSRHKSKKPSKLRVTGLCVGKSPEAGEFPAQMASNAESVSIWWRHYDNDFTGRGNQVTHLDRCKIDFKSVHNKNWQCMNTSFMINIYPVPMHRDMFSCLLHTKND